MAVIPTLEDEIRQRVETIASALLNYEANADPVENLVHFLRADASFLGIVLALMNLSQEKLLRILSAERFAIENLIRTRLDELQQKYGLTHAKGQVRLARKEVDHAIPSTAVLG